MPRPRNTRVRRENRIELGEPRIPAVEPRIIKRVVLNPKKTNLYKYLEREKLAYNKATGNGRIALSHRGHVTSVINEVQNTVPNGLPGTTHNQTTAYKNRLIAGTLARYKRPKLVVEQEAHGGFMAVRIVPKSHYESDIADDYDIPMQHLLPESEFPRVSRTYPGSEAVYDIPINNIRAIHRQGQHPRIEDQGAYLQASDAGDPLSASRTQ